jgi:predicted nucleotidyltransferase
MIFYDDEKDAMKPKIRLYYIKLGGIMEDYILSELVAGILKVMQNKVISIILYGSTARGTNVSESDVDIALLMNGNLDNETEDKLSDFIVDLNLEYDKVFSVIDIDYEMFCKWQKVTPFYKSLVREGVVLWKAA